jgi:hypothetical protein
MGRDYGDEPPFVTGWHDDWTVRAASLDGWNVGKVAGIDNLVPPKHGERIPTVLRPNPKPMRSGRRISWLGGHYAAVFY